MNKRKKLFKLIGKIFQILRETYKILNLNVKNEILLFSNLF
jgi:hypothetical protein